MDRMEKLSPFRYQDTRHITVAAEAAEAMHTLVIVQEETVVLV
jgi:hypothetical protein